MIDVPTLVIFGEESFRNKYDLSDAAFYEKLMNSKMLPTTSQPPPVLLCRGVSARLRRGRESHRPRHG